MSGGTELPGEVTRWISAARQGSTEAVGQLLDACRQYLLLVANQHLDHELRGKLGPSDVVQETFLEAQRDFGHFRGASEEELLAWLRRILLNNLANAARYYRDTDKRSVGREVSLADLPREDLEDVLGASDSPSSPAREEEEQQELDRALAQLPEHYREVIGLRHQEQLSFDEIGRRLGRSADAARKLWARAVEQLEQLMEPPDASS
jgi:RNA polymerase sigma-70 factor (ECF subfamily)